MKQENRNVWTGEVKTGDVRTGKVQTLFPEHPHNTVNHEEIPQCGSQD
jgi:hypothetical protein